MQQYGAPDTDEVVDFEDILDGKCGPIEAAYAQEQAERWRRQTPAANEPVGQIAVDDTGYDMRVGNRAGKRNRVIHAHEDNENITKRILRDRSVKGTDGSAAAAKLSRKRKLDQQVNDAKKRKPGRPPGRPPVLLSPGISAKGPLPAGWSVSLKDSKKEPGKQYKQYKAPDGQAFYTYAKAQEYWQSLGQAPLKQPITDASRLSSKRVARLPVGWEVQAIHHDAGRRQGQVEKVYISPTGQQFDSWSDVKRYCEDEGIPIEAAQDVPDSDAEPEPDFDLAEIMTWLRGVAVTSPERPLIGGGRLMRQAIARMRTCLSKDPSGSALSRRVM